MFDFIDIIVGWLETLGQLFVSFFDHLLLAVTLLLQLTGTPLLVVGFLPPFLGTAVIAALLIFVIKFFLGR